MKQAKPNTLSEEADLVNYILTGSRYQVINDKGELLPEYGVGVFRSGVQLEVARSLYRSLISQRAAEKGYTASHSAAEREAARRVARAAFDYTDAFLEEMDKRMRHPLRSNDGDNP